MSVPMSQQMRDQLTFEQKARYDELLARRQKKEGTARVLSLPLLGTFGLEHFYLGNTLRGVLSVLFSWTLIPTVIALFDLLTGEVTRQVAHANERIARQVYQNVIDNTPKPEDIPAAAASVVAPPPPPTPAPAPTPIEPQSDVTTTTYNETLVTGTVPTAAPATDMSPATPVASDAVVAATDALPEAAAVAAAPAAEAEVVSDTTEQDASATTTATFTTTESSASWQQGMAEPQTTSDSNTYTYTDTVATPPEVTSTVIAEEAPIDAASAVTVDDAPVAEAVVVEAADAAPATSDATPAAPAAETEDIQPSDGVLVFLADDEPAAPAPSPVAEVEAVSATETDDTEQSAYQETVAQQEHFATQQYKDGKLVSATRSDNTLTGEINTLLTEHSTEDIIAEMDAQLGTPAPSTWVDVSPLHTGESAPATNAPSSEGATPSQPASDAPATGSAPSDAAPSTTASDAAGGTTENAPSASTTTPESTAPTSAGGTDVPGGGVGSGGADTDVPGGALGTPTEGNTPGGGLNG